MLGKHLAVYGGTNQSPYHTGVEQTCRQWRNSALASLPLAELELLVDCLKVVSLVKGDRLFMPGEAPSAVYFPISAVISIIYIMADGATMEVAAIGREGAAGMGIFRNETAMSNAVVEVGGLSYRLDIRLWRLGRGEGGPLLALLLKYNVKIMRQICLVTVDSQFSSIEQRLSRWLIDRFDRAPTGKLPVTHEMISVLLGVRRESVTCALRKLHHEGLIHCGRRCISLSDRNGLAHAAGEFYQVGTREAH